MAVFALGPSVEVDLAALGRAWEARARASLPLIGSPWWAPGLVLTASIRARYEQSLPVSVFCRDLARIAERLLPGPAWVPHRLRPQVTACCAVGGGHTWPSLPDLWACLPPYLAGRFAYTSEELPALLCAFADPPRFGTNTGRYPGQQAAMQRVLGLSPSVGAPLMLLDLACGVGHGTHEAAAIARACGYPEVTAVGLTREPLEAWMAATCTLPHDAEREITLRAVAGKERVFFVPGDVRALPIQAGADVVLCNGLLGGPEFRGEPNYHSVLEQVGRSLARDGVFLVASRFHAGLDRDVRSFAAAAIARGWRVAGMPGNLILHRA